MSDALTAADLVRPDVARLAGYVPGEQPRGGNWTKLNTNENPYPPSPRVREAVTAGVGGLNIYPDPLGTSFREAAAEVMGVTPDWVLPGNGSDDCLTILVRSFCDAGDTLALPYPSYILYETLADIQGCRHERMPLRPDWSFDVEASRAVASRAKLVMIPCPNSPSGTVWDAETVLSLMPSRGVLVLDEAYADFADEPLGPKLLKELSGTPEGRRFVVTRTLSKSYSLAGLRIGFAVGHPDLIAEMRKVKDSYNCDSLSLAGGEAALRDRDHFAECTGRIRTTRARMAAELKGLGFGVLPSQANFVWTTHASGRHDDIFAGLKERRVLIRRMKYPNAFGEADLDGLRMSVGSDAEADVLLGALREIVASW